MQNNFIDSIEFSKISGIEHIRVIDKINKLLKLDGYKNHFEEGIYTNKRSRNYKKYLMSRDGYFLLLSTTQSRKNNKLFDLKQDFIKRFMSMEDYLLVKQDIEKFAESNKIDKTKKEFLI